MINLLDLNAKYTNKKGYTDIGSFWLELASLECSKLSNTRTALNYVNSQIILKDLTLAEVV